MSTQAIQSSAGRRHQWGEPISIPGHESHDGNDRTERRCVLCGLIKITVHPPHEIPWREWRTKRGGNWVGAATPPCLDAMPLDGEAA